MAFSENGTKLTNLINPEVMADMFDAKLIDAVRFAPLATIDYTLQGRPGNTVTVPVFKYIGAAADVNEGADIGISKLTTDKDTVAVKKVGKGVEISDEAVLSGYGDPVGESVKQLVLSVADKLEADFIDTLEDIAAGMTVEASGSAITADELADGLTKFGEDMDGEKVLLCSPAQYATFRKADDWLPASDVAADILIRGTVGMIHGCQVVVTNRLATSGDAYVVKPGALRLFIKRDTLVETDRNIVAKSTIMTVDKHYACYLYDASKAIRFTVS